MAKDHIMGAAQKITVDIEKTVGSKNLRRTIDVARG